MKLIFVDIDGILNCNTTRTVTFDGWCFVDDYLVERLKHIVDATGAKIVLSSSWRVGWNRKDESKNEPFFNQLRDKLREYGMEIYDALPTPMRGRRGDAIREWFELNKDKEIESYVILDDYRDMGEFITHLIWINSSTGLTDADVREAIERLNNP